MACAVDWQGNASYPGWRLPVWVGGAYTTHWKIIGGFLPARTIAHGGWIDVFAQGYYRVDSDAANPTLLARLEGNGTYIGPSWIGGYDQGWGWWGQDPGNADLEGGIDYNWTFRLRMTSLGWKGTKDAANADAFWRLEGEFEAWGNDYAWNEDASAANNGGREAANQMTSATSSGDSSPFATKTQRAARNPPARAKNRPSLPRGKRKGPFRSEGPIRFSISVRRYGPRPMACVFTNRSVRRSWRPSGWHR